MADKKISTGEVVGHLRAASRLFKSFEFANAAAELVLNTETTINTLRKDIKGLEKEKKELNAECDLAVQKATEAEKDIIKHKKVVQEAATAAAEHTKIVKAKAKVEAINIISNTEGILKDIEKRILLANTKRGDAEAAQRAAESVLQQIENEVTSAKDKFLKVLG